MYSILSEGRRISGVESFGRLAIPVSGSAKTSCACSARCGSLRRWTFNWSHRHSPRSNNTRPRFAPSAASGSPRKCANCSRMPIGGEAFSCSRKPSVAGDPAPGIRRWAEGLRGIRVLPGWSMTLEILHQLQTPTFATALAALIRGPGHELPTAEARVRALGLRWKLATAECEGGPPCACNGKHCCATAAAVPWPQLQRVLSAHRGIAVLCGSGRSRSRWHDRSNRLCRQMLARPASELNPPPLITGQDLVQMGIPRGPVYRELLDRVRTNNWLADRQPR